MSHLRCLAVALVHAPLIWAFGVLRATVLG
jgi:hypothetical protein